MKKLIKKLLILAGVIILGILVYLFFFDDSDDYYYDEDYYEDEYDEDYYSDYDYDDDYYDDYEYDDDWYDDWYDDDWYDDYYADDYYYDDDYDDDWYDDWYDDEYAYDEDYDDYYQYYYGDDEDSFYNYYSDYYGNYENQEEYEEAAKQVFEEYGDYTVAPAADIKEGTWTILYYICGSNLESDGGYAFDDIKEIANATTNPKIKSIIQTGGSKEWSTKSINANKLERFELSNGKLNKVDSQPQASMGNPNSVSSFIKWAKQKYPAERYMIVFWNHGSGSAYGVCFDELYQPDGVNPDSLSIVEMAQGLKEGGVTFDIIGYDTCLTATIENDYAIAPYGRYVVASEEVEPGEGWNYKSWLAYLCKNPTCATEDLGKHIVDSYLQLCKQNGQDDTATLSLVDLSKIKNVYTSFVKMASEMSANTSDISSFKNIKQEVKSARYFGTRTANEGYTNQTDLGDMAKNLSSTFDKSITDPLLHAIKEAVVYEKHGPSRSEATGISVFYPVKSDASELNLMAEGTTNGPYLAFIDAMCDYWTAPSWVYAAKSDTKAMRTNKDITVSKSFKPVRSKDYSVKFNEFIDKQGFYNLRITSGLDSVDYVTFDLVYLLDDGSDIYLGYDDNIDADWDKGIFKDNFNGTWFTMDGEYMNVYLLEQEEGYNIYSSPIKLNGRETNLRFKYDFNTQEYSILGTHDGTDNYGMSSRRSSKLKNGDKITFMFEVYDAESDENQNVEMGTITYTSSSQIIDDALVDGTYFYYFTFYDIFDNEYTTEGVQLYVEDGEIQISE